VVPPLLSLSDAEHGIFTMIDGMIVTTFMVIVTRGNHPPGLLAAWYILRIYEEIIRALSSVSRSRMRSADTITVPNSHRLRIAVGRCLHTLFAQRGQ